MDAIIITCVQCEADFEFTDNEQEKFRQRGFDIPLRCPQCRKKKCRKEGERSEIRKIRDKKKHYRLKYKEPFEY